MKSFNKMSIVAMLFVVSITMTGCNAADVVTVVSGVANAVSQTLGVVGSLCSGEEDSSCGSSCSSGNSACQSACNSPCAQASVRPSTGVCDIVIYTQPGCGYCEQAKAYFTKKGMIFATKDIAADPTARSEMETKLQTQGMAVGGVPVIDVCGTCIKGFDAGMLERVLAEKTAGKTPTKPAAGRVGPLGQ